MTGSRNKLAIQRLERRLGHRFADQTLLLRACSHRSHGAPHNERLEFLGDGLVNFLVGAELFRRQPNADEGELSRLRATLVCEGALADRARDLDLGEVLCMGPGELRSGGFRRDSILADAFEAIIGALYIDAGFAVAEATCLRLFSRLLTNLPDAKDLKDAKTRLQEYLQGKRRPLPEYVVLVSSGPPHRRQFRVRCTLTDEEIMTEGDGTSRKLAEQQAAAEMLKNLENRHA